MLTITFRSRVDFIDRDVTVPVDQIDAVIAGSPGRVNDEGGVLMRSGKFYAFVMPGQYAQVKRELFQQ